MPKMTNKLLYSAPTFGISSIVSVYNRFPKCIKFNDINGTISCLLVAIYVSGCEFNKAFALIKALVNSSSVTPPTFPRIVFIACIAVLFWS